MQIIVKDAREQIELMRVAQVCSDALRLQVEVAKRIDPNADLTRLRQSQLMMNEIFRAAREAL